MSNLTTRLILCKAISLDRALKDWHAGRDKKAIENRFANTWGGTIGAHYLFNYTCGKELIHSMDADKLERFIETF